MLEDKSMSPQKKLAQKIAKATPWEATMAER
jgi:hypothetical protein